MEAQTWQNPCNLTRHFVLNYGKKRKFLRPFLKLGDRTLRFSRFNQFKQLLAAAIALTTLSNAVIRLV